LPDRLQCNVAEIRASKEGSSCLQFRKSNVLTQFRTDCPIQDSREVELLQQVILAVERGLCSSLKMYDVLLKTLHAAANEMEVL
jgi:hypothetical protein